MRNLKKILALVLALVMSLSLMATASAADFKDASDISENYQTAVNVLEGLKVFKGYAEDNTFRPKGEITRAEVATIIYRIATGDAEDAQASIYTNMTTSFTDLDKAEWARGYINYCHNAQIIKGESASKFNPNGKISGYATLAMILRAMGYGRNGEFEGPQWEINTAAKAKEIGIIDNVMEAQLGSNAPRELVAEILFRALLTEMVDYTILNGYQPNGKTLGQEQFGLEEIKGVVTSNQWASLTSNKVEAEGVTKMKVTEVPATGATSKVGDTITLNYSEDYPDGLDAVGLRHVAYIAKDGSAKKVLTMSTDGLNTIAYNEGKGVNSKNVQNWTWKNIADLADEENLTTTADTEWFVNYTDEWDKNVTSKYRISYAIAKDSLNDLPGVNDKAAWREYIAELDTLTNHGTIPAPASSKYPGHYLAERNIKIDFNLNGRIEAGETIDCWVVAIAPQNVINQNDLDIMQNIFYTADRIGTNGTVAEYVQNYAVGEVYVGTTSMTDYSDTWSWVDFQEEYFTTKYNSEKIDKCELGNSLRIVDNNNDGKAEYVLKIAYTQDKVVGTYKDNLLCNSLALSEYPEGNRRYSPDELAQGTVVNYAEIDNKLYIFAADIVTDKITTKNFQKITVTTASGDEKGQSGIVNATKLDQDIMLMNQNTDYNMYLDEYGYIRSYELAQGSKYALLTEMYPTTDRNSNYVRDFRAVAEVKIGEEDVTEHPVVANVTPTTLFRNGNYFFNNYVWTYGLRGYLGIGAMGSSGTPVISNTNNANYLQPAIAHLGVTAAGEPNVDTGATNNEVNYYLSAWNRAVTTVDATNATAATGGAIGVFDYGKETGTTAAGASKTGDHSFSFTNVATYTLGDNDAITLGTASKLATSAVDGRQIYRLGSTLNGVAAYTHGTEAELKAEYLKANPGKVSTDADAWFTANRAIKDGQHIYPVYATDYVHLDLTKADDGKVLGANDLVVKPGIRHFHIDDNYGKNYNTNSNVYVDATVDTEFYIVLPGTAKSILYRVGYADLPQIKVSEIRAAYAVAHNTKAQSNGQDYWVADVVVIETNLLDYNYDSIALSYYNPYETTGYIRYADTLNNEWYAKQAGTDYFAKMGVIPKAGFDTLTWGNTTWGDDNLGFYKLYQTDWAEPNTLTVGKGEKITDNFNTYGIYAGRARRIEDLQTSNYMDVWTEKTGNVQNYSVDINFGEANEVPFYRIEQVGQTYVATKLDLNNVLRRSDAHNNDELIWVYNMAKNEVAFVVDLASRNKTDDGFNYTAPTWLSTLYSDILKSQATIATSGIPVTIKSVGLPTGKNYEYTEYASADEKGMLFLNEAALLAKGQTGYSITTIGNAAGADVTALSVNGNNSVAQAVGADGYWKISDGSGANVGIKKLAAGKHYELVVTYSVVNRNLSLTSPGTIKATVNGTVTDPYTSTNNIVSHYGENFAFVVSGLNETMNTYTLTAGGDKLTDGNVTINWNAAGTVATITGTMPNKAYALTLTATAKNVAPITVTTGAGVSVSFTTNAAGTGTPLNSVAASQSNAAAGNVFPGTAIDFTVDSSALAPNTYLGKVTYTVPGASAVECTSLGNGRYAVPGDKVGLLGVLITVNVESSAKQTLTLTNNSGAQGIVNADGIESVLATGSNTVQITNKTGVATVTTTVNAYAAVTSGSAKVTTVDNRTFTITNVTGAAATVTFAPIPVAGLAGTTNLAGGAFDGMDKYLVSGLTVTKGEGNSINVSGTIPTASQLNLASPGPFKGFGNGNGAAALANARTHNAAIPADTTRFAFYAVDIYNTDGTHDDAIMFVAPGTPNGTVTIGSVTWTVTYTGLVWAG